MYDGIDSMPENMPAFPCPTCGGLGWDVGMEHDPSCDDGCRQGRCPIPVQVQCSTCGGSGEIEPEEQDCG